LEGENDVRPFIKEQNPHIKNWGNIPKSTKIYFEFPEELREHFFHRTSSTPVYNRVGQMEDLPKDVFKKWIAQLKTKEKTRIVKTKKDIKIEVENAVIPFEKLPFYYEEGKTVEIKKTIEEKDPYPIGPSKKHSLYGFYSTSFGNLYDTVKSSGNQAKIDQNSPYTFGFGGTYLLDPGRWWSYSFYLSQISATTDNQTSAELSIPRETGLTFYYNMDFPFPGLSLYLGFDNERFSSFNVEEYENGANLGFRNHSITYLTLGFSKYLKVFERMFLIKGSYSLTFWSTVVGPQGENETEYTGRKTIFHMTYFWKKKWTIHAFFKNHELSGTTNLEVYRYGAGVGYTFF
jgi:hypothetical protein